MSLKAVCICNSGHTLLRKVYHVLYDQIGFIIDNKMWLYWNIPTGIMHYIGPIHLPTIGIKIFYSSLREKFNEEIVIEILKTIPQEESSLLKIMRTIGITYSIPKSDIMGVMDLFLALFYPPHLNYSDNTIVEPICKDIITKISNNPPSFPAEDLFLLCSEILHKIKGKNPLIPYSLIEKLSFLLNEEPPSMKESAFIIYSNGKLKENILRVRDRLSALFQAESKQEIETLHIREFINLLNIILVAYGESEIKINHHPLSLLINSGEDTISVDNRMISLSLSKIHANRLTKEELERLLYLMDTLNCNTGEFDHLRTIITERLYHLLEGINKSS